MELIITYRDDFETYIICKDDTEVDFDESFLIAGMKGHHQCLLLHKKDLFMKYGTLLYSIEIREADCFVPTAISYIVNIPIQYSQYAVAFNVFWGDCD